MGTVYPRSMDIQPTGVDWFDQFSGGLAKDQINIFTWEVDDDLRRGFLNSLGFPIFAPTCPDDVRDVLSMWKDHSIVIEASTLPTRTALALFAPTTFYDHTLVLSTRLPTPLPRIAMFNAVRHFAFDNDGNLGRERVRTVKDCCRPLGWASHQGRATVLRRADIDQLRQRAGEPVSKEPGTFWSRLRRGLLLPL